MIWVAGSGSGVVRTKRLLAAPAWPVPASVSSLPAVAIGYYVSVWRTV